MSLLLATIPMFASNPMLRGKWKGVIVTKDNTDIDNKNGLIVNLYITDDNDVGDFRGEMTVSYRYQTDVYKAKYQITGKLDYNTYKFRIRQDKYIFSDVLPKGLNWCIGSGDGRIYRSKYKKRIIMDGNLATNCGGDRLHFVLVKQ
ncbi:MAG: hypothetical protein IPL21_03570 [Saprospirales bacterium]|nr:hypothetical protein [Saprospirales bacterium]